MKMNRRRTLSALATLGVPGLLLNGCGGGASIDSAQTLATTASTGLFQTKTIDPQSGLELTYFVDIKGPNSGELRSVAVQGASTSFLFSWGEDGELSQVDDVKGGSVWSLVYANNLIEVRRFTVSGAFQDGLVFFSKNSRLFRGEMLTTSYAISELNGITDITELFLAQINAAFGGQASPIFSMKSSQMFGPSRLETKFSFSDIAGTLTTAVIAKIFIGVFVPIVTGIFVLATFPVSGSTTLLAALAVLIVGAAANAKTSGPSSTFSPLTPAIRVPTPVILAAVSQISPPPVNIVVAQGFSTWVNEVQNQDGPRVNFHQLVANSTLSKDLLLVDACLPIKSQGCTGLNTLAPSNKGWISFEEVPPYYGARLQVYRGSESTELFFEAPAIIYFYGEVSHSLTNQVRWDDATRTVTINVVLVAYDGITIYAHIVGVGNY